MRTYMGIDIGTTNSKVGVCSEYWRMLDMRILPNKRCVTPSGRSAIDAKLLWNSLCPAIGEFIKKYRPLSIGITGMAEPGVLVERETGKILTDILPWTDAGSVPFAEKVSLDGREEERFLHTGLHNSYKYAVYKVLTEQEDRGLDLENVLFLQAAPFVCYCLTGVFATDPTLALRTYAYDMESGAYNSQFLAKLGLPEEIFPEILHSGQMAGVLRKEWKDAFGCEEAPTVSVCGHDHMCAFAAVGGEGEDLFLSMGTTGVLSGSFPRRTLDEMDWKTGYSYGLHVKSGQMTWLGALPALGSTVDWCRQLLGFSGEDYHSFDQLLMKGVEHTDGPLFFPYLSGSGAPNLNSGVCGGFCGLKLDSDRCDIAHAVMEGMAYEMRMILERAPVGGEGVIRAVGGGTRNGALLQILSDVLGREVILPDCEQAALIGAAMLSSGLPAEPVPAFETRERFYPDIGRNRKYKRKYEQAFLPGQSLIRNICCGEPKS